MLKGIVIGRSDVAGSLGMTKADVNSKKSIVEFITHLKRLSIKIKN